MCPSTVLWELDPFQQRALDARTAGKPGTDITVLEPVDERRNKGNQPQKGTDEIDPNSILHALDAAVALGVFVDKELPKRWVSKTLGEKIPKKKKAKNTNLAKHAKEGNPKNKQNKIPNRRNDANGVENKGDKVSDASNGRESANNNSVNLQQLVSRPPFLL